MKTLLKDLYDCFYTPPEFSEQKQEVEEFHQALIKALEKKRRVGPFVAEGGARVFDAGESPPWRWPASRLSGHRHSRRPPSA